MWNKADSVGEARKKIWEALKDSNFTGAFTDGDHQVPSALTIQGKVFKMIQDRRAAAFYASGEKKPVRRARHASAAVAKPRARRKPQLKRVRPSFWLRSHAYRAGDRPWIHRDAVAVAYQDAHIFPRARAVKADERAHERLHSRDLLPADFEEVRDAQSRREIVQVVEAKTCVRPRRVVAHRAGAPRWAQGARDGVVRRRGP